MGEQEQGDLASPSDLDDLIGYNLKRAYLVVQSDFRRVLGDDGLNPRSFSVLSLAVQFPEITQSMVARRLNIERSGLVAIVDDLEGRGLLTRVPVPGDRRVQALVPTPAGQTAYRVAFEAARRHEDELLQDLSVDERTTLLALLTRIRGHDVGL